MRIKLKNFNNRNINIQKINHEMVNDSEYIKSDLQVNKDNEKYDLKEITSILMNSNITNNNVDDSLNIIFENFSIVSSIQFSIKNFFRKEKIMGALYDKENKTIHITKELLEKTVNQSSTYTESLYSKVT